MATLLTVDEVKARIDWDLDAGEEKLCLGYLETLSDDARYYAGKEWFTGAEAPPRVLSLILRATVRFLRNPEGASQSRAGDETLMWDNRHNEKAGSPYFTDDEIDELKTLGGSSGGYAFGTLATWSWNNGTGRQDLTIGTDPDGDPMPWVSKDDEVYW